MNHFIRPVTIDDAQKRHELYYYLVERQTGMMPLLSEINIHTSESYDHIKDFLINKKGLWLICESQNKIIGEVDITINKAQKQSHIGCLTIGVHPSYQGQGIGSMLMEKALEWALNQKLKKITLSVFRSNIAAQNLYKKFGFIIEGIRKEQIRHINGSLEDDILMAKFL